MNKLAKTISASGVIAAVLTTVSVLSLPITASADSNTTELRPIEVNEEITYRYFDAPSSVFADASGIVVSDKNGITAISHGIDSFNVRSTVADKCAREGEVYVTLESGALCAYYGSTKSSLAGSYTDFCLYNGVIYAITNNTLTKVPIGETSLAVDSATTVTMSCGDYDNITATALTVSENGVFVAVDSAVFANKQDIATIDENGVLTPCMLQSDPVLSMSVMPHTGIIYTVTRDKTLGYTFSGGGLVRRYSQSSIGLTDVFCYDGFIYALDSIDSLSKISGDLTSTQILVASANSANGFYNMPSGIAVKSSALYVADTANDRVSILGSENSYINNVSRPISVVCDSAGEIYVAGDYGSVSVYALSGNASPSRNFATIKVPELLRTITVNERISQILIDADRTLYILTHSGLWVANADADTARKIDSTPYKQIALSIGRNELYGLYGTSINKLTVSGNSCTSAMYCTAPASAFSFAVDLNGNVFMLSANRITAHIKDKGVTDYGLTVNNSSYVLGHTAGQIVLCTVENDYVHYGDIIITDTYKHRLFTLDGSLIGAKLVDDDYDVPDISHDDTPDYYASGLIRVALYDTEVFGLPMETPAIYTIAKDRKVIVPQYSLEDTREYSLILIDNIDTGELIQGYVYKDALSEPLPYVAPPSHVGTVYSTATPVYKWPSRNAQTVNGFSSVERNTQFDILDFVESYRDDYNNLWYRIRIADNYEGYILAVNLSLMDYEPTFIRPAYNAEIISYNGSTDAVTYALTNGKYVPLTTALTVGTKVEVVGAFDSSLEYTQIKYMDSNLGTLTCYVKTAYLKYNGVNIVLIVAITVIIITVALATIILMRVYYVKKRRLVDPVSGDD